LRRYKAEKVSRFFPSDLTLAENGVKMIVRVVPMIQANRTAPNSIDSHTLPSSPLASVFYKTGQSFREQNIFVAIKRLNSMGQKFKNAKF